MASYNILTEDRKKLIKSIADKVNSYQASVQNIIDLGSSSSNTYSEGPVVTIKSTNGKEIGKYNIRTTFPGTVQQGFMYDKSALPNGGKYKDEVNDCIKKFFKGETSNITKFKNFYTTSELGGLNPYKNSCVYPVDGASGRKSWVGNCVAYATGRFAEIHSDVTKMDATTVFGKIPGAFDGSNFFSSWASNQPKNNSIFECVTPSQVKNASQLVGSIACIGTRHVVVIEKIEGNKVYVSQSSYSGLGAHVKSGDGKFGCLFEYYTTSFGSGYETLGASFLGSSWKVTGYVIHKWNK